MNTHLSSDSNGNSSENLASNCVSNDQQQQHKTNLPCEVNSMIKTILDQLTGLEDVMMDNEDDDLNVNVDSNQMNSEEDLDTEDDDEEDDATLAGYRYCAEETVRFLIQEEHFSPDDPVIIELQLHLEEQQRRLQERIKKQQPPVMTQETSNQPAGSCETDH